MRRIGAPGIRLPKMVPDVDGRRCVLGLAILAGLILALFGKAVERIWLLPLGIPLAWGTATALVGRFFPRWTRPCRLLKLEINRVPDQLRTLVVMPALLSSPKRAAEVCAKLEALGCLERDENIRYLLLGDFADAEAEHADGDEAVAQAARREIARMNDRAGEEKYFYLHRGRELLKADEKWMGRDRKRGALMALNRLLLGEEGAQDAFSVENGAAEKLRGRYRYVLTADCDTRFLPDAARRLIGALAHPLNASRAENGVRRGYAVLQPQMELGGGRLRQPLCAPVRGNRRSQRLSHVHLQFLAGSHRARRLWRQGPVRRAGVSVRAGRRAARGANPQPRPDRGSHRRRGGGERRDLLR